MLTHIDIRHFTIIPTLSLEFSSGMTVLTGETGAGKSIILNALTLALGARAKKNCVRDKKKPAEITLSFFIEPNSLAEQWLQEKDLHDGPDCIIRRIIYADGKSKNTINGRPCPLSLTRNFADHLIHIHSQHQQQQLLKSAWQCHYLDHFGNSLTLVDALKKTVSDWQALNQRIDALKQNKGSHEHELALVSYQLEELNTLAPEAGEWDRLSTEHTRLSQHENYCETIETCLQYCKENDKSNTLTLIQKTIAELSNYQSGPSIQTIINELKQAAIHCEEAADGLSSLLHNDAPAEQDINTINQRLERLDSIARKHHISPNKLPEQLLLLEQKKHTLTHSDEYLLELEENCAALLSQYKTQAKRLSTARKKSATKLGKQITTAIHDLNMPGSVFDITLKPRDGKPHAQGNEQIQFLLSTQPGVAPQPLTEVASGGELSRITLTLMLATAESTQMPVFIFDEVDVGLGGQTAKLVGQVIRGLSKHSQVFCITHLPQVAALAHQHYRVDKALDAACVTSTISILNETARIAELARMTSGDAITDEALKHASTLIDQTACHDN